MQESSDFFNVSIDSYEFPLPKHHVWILVHPMNFGVFIFIQLHVFSFFPCDFFLYPLVSWKCIVCLVTQSCPTLCNSMDDSPPDSVYGILQARLLELVAMPSSWGCSQPRDRTQVSCIASRFFTIWINQGSSGNVLSPTNMWIFQFSFC